MNKNLKNGLNTTFVTAVVLAVLVVFLSPFVFMIVTSLKTREQISVVGAPIWPAAQPKFSYNDKETDVFTVPMAQCVGFDPATTETRNLAIVGSEKVFDLSATLSLLENAAAMQYCDIVVTNDTGLMHIPVAMARKTVAIFGSTVREFGFFPLSAERSSSNAQALPVGRARTSGDQNALSSTSGA